MKKIVLSTLAALAIGTVSLSANQFYVNEEGQVFINPGEGRTLLKDDNSASKKLSKEDKAEIKSDLLSEIKSATPLFAKADKLKFSATVYTGYKFTDFDDSSKEDESEFQLRRAYFQVKAYLLDDPKSYYRVTMDVTTNANNEQGTVATDEYETVIMKYAYLYINDVLPFTGVEIGQVHRPWIDYEEHNSWFYRSIQKVFVEDGNSAHLTNSADLGFNLKTKTKYFASEVGVFQGEGYHDSQVSNGMSLEWRATAHLLGVDGKDKALKKTYWDASFYGQLNYKHKAVAVGGIEKYEDLEFYGLHTVYNMPEFQLAAQYITSEDTGSAFNAEKYSLQAGDGYNAHAIFRFGSSLQYEAIARYDSWTNDNIDLEQTNTTVGLAWQQNRNVKWIANVELRDDEGTLNSGDSTAYLVTAQLNF